jgi:hypothetical protein
MLTIDTSITSKNMTRAGRKTAEALFMPATARERRVEVEPKNSGVTVKVLNLGRIANMSRGIIIKNKKELGEF